MVNLWPFGDEKWPPYIWAGGHRPPVAKSQKYPWVLVNRARLTHNFLRILDFVMSVYGCCQISLCLTQLIMTRFWLQEWRHAHGMRCLGIPNTAHFANVTLIEDAIACKILCKMEISLLMRSIYRSVNMYMLVLLYHVI